MGVQDRDWYWEPRSRSQGRRSQGKLHPATILALSIIGAVLILAIGVSVMQWRAQVAAEQIMRTSQDMQQKMQLRAQQAQREEAARQERRQALLQQQEAMRLQAIAERQRGEEDARRAAADAVDRKAKAWAKFYRKPATCEDAATMECANAFIRAQRNFEEKYTRGEL